MARDREGHLHVLQVEAAYVAVHKGYLVKRGCVIKFVHESKVSLFDTQGQAEALVDRLSATGARPSR